MSDTVNSHPTNSQLLKAILVALAAAGILLVIAVVPAEFGVDPTGFGKRLGLTALRTEPTPPAAPEVPAATNAASAAPIVAREAVAYQDGEMSVTLQPQQGAEVKALMREGGAFVFSWKATGPVNFDMHGERPNDGDRFTSYWMDRQQTSADGSFIAPFDGSHGWYWKNKGTSPVVVTVRVSGFFEKLYRPH